MSLKKDEASLKTNIENLTDDEEEILKFARKNINFLSQMKLYLCCRSSVIEQLAIASCFSCMNGMVQETITYCKMKSLSCFYTYGIYTKINVVKILSIVL